MVLNDATTEKGSETALFVNLSFGFGSSSKRGFPITEARLALINIFGYMWNHCNGFVLHGQPKSIAS